MISSEVSNLRTLEDHIKVQLREDKIKVMTMEKPSLKDEEDPIETQITEREKRDEARYQMNYLQFALIPQLNSQTNYNSRMNSQRSNMENTTI